LGVFITTLDEFNKERAPKPPRPAHKKTGVEIVVINKEIYELAKTFCDKIGLSVDDYIQKLILFDLAANKQITYEKYAELEEQ